MEARMSVTPWHHRWNILALTMLSQALGLGIHQFTFAFWVVPWLDEFQAPRSGRVDRRLHHAAADHRPARRRRLAPRLPGPGGPGDRAPAACRMAGTLAPTRHGRSQPHAARFGRSHAMDHCPVAAQPRLLD